MKANATPPTANPAISAIPSIIRVVWSMTVRGAFKGPRLLVGCCRFQRVERELGSFDVDAEHRFRIRLLARDLAGTVKCAVAACCGRSHRGAIHHVTEDEGRPLRGEVRIRLAAQRDDVVSRRTTVP